MFLFATCCYKMHTNIIKNMLQKLTKMVPKWFQNLSKIDPGGALEAAWEPPLKQDLIFDNFGSILGPPLGPVWGHFGHHVFYVFLKWLFDGLGLHLGSQNTSKMRPKRGSNQSMKIIDCVCLFTILWPRSGVLKIIIVRCFFGTLFWDGFWSPFW